MRLKGDNKKAEELRNKMRRTELHEQITVIVYLKIAYPNVLFTIAPNGMKLSIGVAVKLKRMGYSKGTPDIMIFERNKNYNGLFIEMKNPQSFFNKKGVVSPEQKEWQRKLILRGYKSEICYGFDEAKKVIDEYFGEQKKYS